MISFTVEHIAKNILGQWLGPPNVVGPGITSPSWQACVTSYTLLIYGFK